MSAPRESYRKVFYDLRPAKQVERRMMVDAFQRLAQGGFGISDYQYTGFGSLYFVDFIMFHRWLGIQRLLNVEYSSKVKRRVVFNSPFGLICHEFKPASEVIPTLSPDLKHILWLDYDDIMSASIVEDTLAAAAQLSPGSILAVTVDAEPPTEPDDPRGSLEYFEEEVGSYLGPGLGLQDFTRSRLPSVNATILSNAIAAGLVGRKSVKFLQLFNIVYKDGHRMLTVGGMIGSEEDGRKLRGCNLDSLPFLRTSPEEGSYEIRVPRLTRKERLYLDAYMPCRPGWRPGAFELAREDIEAYAEIYRYYPSFVELLL